jgi:chaperonin GroEL (HSP60 family)
LTSIEVLNGFNFKCKNLIFANGSFSKAKLLVVDGLIESVAEINSLLQAFSETKETLLFVARGFDPDVINTLKVNFLRKTLNVIPFTVAYDFEGLNVLNDIAIVGCTDVVSSMKGQLISQIKYEEIICVDSVVIKGDSFTIVNDKAISRVKSHVSFLFEKRGTVALDQFEKIYDDRIKSLTPSSVRIRIANDHDTQAIIEKFDVALRLLRSSMLRGCIRTSFMKKKYGLFETFPDVYVLEAVLAAVAFATSCEKTIKNSLLISNV